MTRLDKTRFGGYVKVIGRIARESISPFVIILILLCGFLAAFRNRSVHKDQEATPSFNATGLFNTSVHKGQEATSSFDTMNKFNGSFEFSFFQIYFMMAGDHQTEEMGVDNLTWPNLVTFVIYFLFMFLISSLALNIFTGIAINEIQILIERSNIQIMKDQIDYIYDGDYSIFIYLDSFERFRKFKKWFFGKVTKVYVIPKWIKGRTVHYCTKWRNCSFSCYHAEDSDKGSSPAEDSDKGSSPAENLNQVDFVDDKYTENFETLEYSAKKLEDRTKKLESLILNNNYLSSKRIENLEDKLEKSAKNLEEKNEKRNKNLEDKLNMILEDKLEKSAKNLEEKNEKRNKNLEDKLNMILEKLATLQNN